MKKSTLLLILLAFVMSSCHHSYYVAPPRNVPLFKEKNEFRGNMGLGLSGETTTADFQAAYSITNHFAVMTNFMSLKGGDESAHDSWNGHYFDFGAGYFQNLENDLIFEIYGGVGTSSQQHLYRITTWNAPGGTVVQNTGEADLSFVRLFLQPSIGFSMNAFDVAFTTTISSINFNKINNQIDRIDDEYLQVDKISLNKNSFLIEPGLTLRGGWKNIKLQLQFTYSKNLTHPNLRYNDKKAAIGISFAFAERFKRKDLLK